MDIGKTITIILATVFIAWMLLLTYTINNNDVQIDNYIEKIDSLESRVQKLEYFIEKQQPCTVVVNVNELKPIKK
jgi:preprotein translocase subunit SecG